MFPDLPVHEAFKLHKGGAEFGNPLASALESCSAAAVSEDPACQILFELQKSIWHLGSAEHETLYTS